MSPRKAVVRPIVISDRRKSWAITCAVVFLATAVGLSFAQTSPPAVQDTQGASTVKPVGTIQAIAGNFITLSTDAGSAVNVLIQDSTRMVRTAPGQKDLKTAAPIQLPDLRLGDRMLVRGRASEDGKSVVASSVVVMKAADIAAKQERDKEDWQKRGIGGLVTAVDTGSRTITISVSTMRGTDKVTIHASKDTMVRRYAADSVKFDDATPASVDQIKVGDQLRARGVRSGDGSELAAEEIVSGSFRNIAGTVVSVDTQSNSITVLDLSSRRPVTLKTTPDSQLRSLPPMMAQRIASRLKGSGPDNKPATSGSASATPSSTTANVAASSRSGGPSDFQQMLKNMAPVTLTDLQKGAAVMIVATEGTVSTQPRTITLLSGVEPILTASPDNSRAAMLLSPWNLGGADAAAGANP